MEYSYRFAELNIGVSSLHDDVHRLCRDYLADGTETAFDVSTDQSDIDYERDRSARLASTVGLWRLGCNMDMNAAEVAYGAIADGNAPVSL